MRYILIDLDFGELQVCGFYELPHYEQTSIHKIVMHSELFPRIKEK